MAKFDQSKFREILVGFDLQWVADRNPHMHTLPDESEERLEAKESFVERILELARQHFTARQWSVFEGVYLQGYNQLELADRLGVHQTNITKCLYGNIDYSREPPKRYGGLKKKLLKLIEGDDRCQQLIRDINGYSDEWCFRIPKYLKDTTIERKHKVRRKSPPQ